MKKRLALINGSPRGTKSNTKILLEEFVRGIEAAGGNYEIHTYLLNLESKADECANGFLSADIALVAFPLYTDAMPSTVKLFFEKVAHMKGDRPEKLGFIVQSGFPEAIHTEYIEKYLHRFSQRVGCQYLGTVRRGGVEGLQVRPAAAQRRMLKPFRALGQAFAHDEALDPRICASLIRKRRFPAVSLPFFRLLNRLGIFDLYWDMQLKQNNAFARRYDQPYTS